MNIVYRKVDLYIVSSDEYQPNILSLNNQWGELFGGENSDYDSIQIDINNFRLERNESGEVIAVEDGLTIAEQRQVIINQLTQLDKSLTRTEENIISHMIDTLNYQPYQREIDIAMQKQALRKQLQALEVLYANNSTNIG